MPGLDVAFLVIVTTSFRLSPVDGTVLICESLLVSIFKPELSVTHLLALAHLASQSGPAWHVICAGFDNPASGLPPPAQLQAPKRTHAISEFSRTYLMAIPPMLGQKFRPAIAGQRYRAGRYRTSIPIPNYPSTACAFARTGRAPTPSSSAILTGSRSG
jgi:hypothetical protein